MASGLVKGAVSSSKTLKLRPLVKSMKELAEQKLSSSSDFVLFNRDTSTGITDLSFERHIDEKRVSLYFDSSENGVEAYRNTVQRLTESRVQKLELKYTPHFGQSRISFEWDHFFDFFNTNNQSNLLKSFSDDCQLQLFSGNISDDEDK